MQLNRTILIGGWLVARHSMYYIFTYIWLIFVVCMEIYLRGLYGYTFKIDMNSLEIVSHLSSIIGLESWQF